MVDELNIRIPSCIMSPWCSRLLALLFIQQSLSKYLFVLETPLILPLGYSLLLQSGQPSKFKGEIKFAVPATSPPFRVSISIHYSLLLPEEQILLQVPP